MTKKHFVNFSVMVLFLVFMASSCDQGKPDLVVDNITLTPANPTTCDKILFKALIKNNGTKGASPSTAAMRVGGETNPQQFNIPALNPGQSQPIQRIQQLDVAQNYRVTVYADYANAVPESNENNNEKYKNFKVTNGCPDLMVKTITITPPNPTPNSPIKFEALIVNIGNCPVPSTKAAMRVGGETNPKIFDIPALISGASHVIGRSQSINVAGNYRVTVYADYGNNLAECNETNNEKYKDFTVQ
ncbi:MAG: hypothetical protein JSV88_09365 [Candidatus Aminicenantes bacterium]|nr:MAG: hypothetical protein JSV88_09365 [Candidatus Aminicenantes bacterium]